MILKAKVIFKVKVMSRSKVISRSKVNLRSGCHFKGQRSLFSQRSSQGQRSFQGQRSILMLAIQWTYCQVCCNWNYPQNHYFSTDHCIVCIENTKSSHKRFNQQKKTQINPCCAIFIHTHNHNVSSGLSFISFANYHLDRW